MSKRFRTRRQKIELIRAIAAGKHVFPPTIIWEHHEDSNPIDTDPEARFIDRIAAAVDIIIDKVLHPSKPKAAIEGGMAKKFLQEKQKSEELEAMMCFGTQIGEDPKKHERMYGKEWYNIYIK